MGKKTKAQTMNLAELGQKFGADPSGGSIPTHSEGKEFGKEFGRSGGRGKGMRDSEETRADLNEWRTPGGSGGGKGDDRGGGKGFGRRDRDAEPSRADTGNWFDRDGPPRGPRDGDRDGDRPGARGFGGSSGGGGGSGGRRDDRRGGGDGEADTNDNWRDGLRRGGRDDDRGDDRGGDRRGGFGGRPNDRDRGGDRGGDRRGGDMRGSRGGDDDGPWRRDDERGGGDRDGPSERPRLALKPRTKPVGGEQSTPVSKEDDDAKPTRTRADPFGSARPAGREDSNSFAGGEPPWHKRLGKDTAEEGTGDEAPASSQKDDADEGWELPKKPGPGKYVPPNQRREVAAKPKARPKAEESDDCDDGKSDEDDDDDKRPPKVASALKTEKLVPSAMRKRQEEEEQRKRQEAEERERRDRARKQDSDGFETVTKPGRSADGKYVPPGQRKAEEERRRQEQERAAKEKGEQEKKKQAEEAKLQAERAKKREAKERNKAEKKEAQEIKESASAKSSSSKPEKEDKVSKKERELREDKLFAFAETCESLFSNPSADVRKLAKDAPSMLVRDDLQTIEPLSRVLGPLMMHCREKTDQEVVQEIKRCAPLLNSLINESQVHRFKVKVLCEAQRIASTMGHPRLSPASALIEVFFDGLYLAEVIEGPYFEWWALYDDDTPDKTVALFQLTDFMAWLRSDGDEDEDDEEDEDEDGEDKEEASEDEEEDISDIEANVPKRVGVRPVRAPGV